MSIVPALKERDPPARLHSEITQKQHPRQNSTVSGEELQRVINVFRSCAECIRSGEQHFQRLLQPWTVLVRPSKCYQHSQFFRFLHRLLKLTRMDYDVNTVGTSGGCLSFKQGEKKTLSNDSYCLWPCLQLQKASLNRVQWKWQLVCLADSRARSLFLFI